MAIQSKTFRALLAAAILSLVAVPAHAFRCGSRIITRGDHADKILRFCGEPVSIQTRYSERGYIDEYGRRFRGFTEELIIEEWTFNFGPRQLMRVVRLENGFVADVKVLGYGY
jgi:hypothetical protein